VRLTDTLALFKKLTINNRRSLCESWKDLLYFWALPRLRKVVLEFESHPVVPAMGQEHWQLIKSLEKYCASLTREDRLGNTVAVQLQGSMKERSWSDTTHSIDYHVYTLVWEVTSLNKDNEGYRSPEPGGILPSVCYHRRAEPTRNLRKVALREDYRQRWDAEGSLLKFAAGDGNQDE
jgi:hypothetical protein